MKQLHMAAYVLLFAGGLNWGMVGLFNYNLVASLVPGLASWVYILVGASTVYLMFTHQVYCKHCADMTKKG